MNTAQALLAFVGTASILTVTPGLDTALVLRSAASGGPRRAACAAIGISLGCLTWGAAVSLGLGALLAASRIAYTTVRWTGAGYLLWHGVRLLVRPRTRFDTPKVGETTVPPTAFLRQGLLTNALNPKIGVFYITFLPQFLPTGANVALFSFLLATIHVSLSLVWFTVLILATVPMERIVKRPRMVRAMDRTAGAVFIGFGAKLAITK